MDSPHPLAEPDTHYAVLMVKEQDARLVLTCGSAPDSEMYVGWIDGGQIRELQEEEDSFPGFSNPLFIDCPQHGVYVGLWQILPAAQEGANTPFLLLFPQPNVERLSPFQAAKHLSSLLGDDPPSQKSPPPLP